MEGFDGRVFDRSHHPLCLAIGPGMVRFCPTVLDTISEAQGTEDMIDDTVF